MIVSILIFLVVLSVLILVHEFGHFIVAKRAGIWVEEFGLGLPPRAIGKKIGETIYSLNWLPFGGFVRLHGENVEEGITDKKRAFLYKSKKTRALVVTAGVIMNFLLAILAFTIVYSFSGFPAPVKTVKVLDIVQGSPALTAGIVVGDVIKKVNGHEIKDTTDFQNLIQESKGKKVILEIQSGGGDTTTVKHVTLAALQDKNDGRYYLGIVIPSDIFFPPVWQRPFYGAYYGFKDALSWGNIIARGLWNVITGIAAGQAPKELSGPVGIFAVTTEAAKNGILTLINFVGILSVNLAILNIIPFPALDGGRLLFIGIESIIGKKVVPKVEATIHTVGMIILLLILLAITIGDVKHLITAGGISNFLSTMGK